MKEKLDIACTANVSVSFGAKKDRGTGFSVLAAQEMEREPKKMKDGEGEGKERNSFRQTEDFENLARQRTGS